MAEASLIPKKVQSGAEAYQSDGLGAFFRISFIFLILTLVLLGGLFAYKALLGKQITDQKAVLTKLQVEFEPSLIAQLERVSSAITTVRGLIKNHTTPSKVFDILEKNTLPDVTFASFNYSGDRRTLILAAQAPGYTAVSEQTRIFQNLPEVASAVFSGPSLSDTGAVNFTLNITFK